MKRLRVLPQSVTDTMRAMYSNQSTAFVAAALALVAARVRIRLATTGSRSTGGPADCSTTLVPMTATVPRSAALTRSPELLPADEKARIAATLLTRVRETS